MENNELDHITHVPDNEIATWVMVELKALRSENEKLMKVCEAAETYVYHRNGGFSIAPIGLEDDIREALKEWKGEK